MSDSDIVKAVADDLFCVGRSNEAKRLVIEQLDGTDGGGFCRQAVESHVQKAVDLTRAESADEIRRLQSKIESIRLMCEQTTVGVG